MRIRVAAAHCIALALTADPGSGFVQANEDNERVTRGGDYVFDVEPEKLRTFFRRFFKRTRERPSPHRLPLRQVGPGWSGTRVRGASASLIAQILIAWGAAPSG